MSGSDIKMSKSRNRKLSKGGRKMADFYNSPIMTVVVNALILFDSRAQLIKIKEPIGIIKFQNLSLSHTQMHRRIYVHAIRLRIGS